MKNVVVGAVVVGLMGSVAYAGAPAAKGMKDEEGVKATVAEMVTRWGTHDPKQLAALYSADAVIINPWGRVAKGTAEIEKLYADEHVGATAPLKDTTETMTVTSWRSLGAGHAFVDADADLVGMKGPDGKAMPGKHHMVLVMEKKADKWLVTDARPYMFAPPMAKPAAAPMKK